MGIFRTVKEHSWRDRGDRGEREETQWKSINQHVEENEFVSSPVFHKIEHRI